MKEELPDIRIVTHRGKMAFTWGVGRGKRHRVIHFPDDPRAVEKQRLEILVELKGGVSLKRKQIDLEQNILDFIVYKSLKCGESQLKNIEQRLRRILTEAKIKYVDQLDSARIEAVIAQLRKIPASPKKKPEDYPKLGASSRNDYRHVIKAFAAWLWRKNRTDTHLLLDLDMELETDLIKRTRFYDDELDLLINAASESKQVIEGYDGRTRAWLYVLAVVTGYRRKELGEITTDSFDFALDPPTLTVEIGRTKNKRKAVQPFRAELIAPLKEFFADREGVIFPKLASLKTHKMVDSDMEEACIPKRVKEGVRVFHSLRHTFASALGSSGLPITEVRDLSRHEDIRTTAGYMHSDRGAAKRAVEVLPNPPIPGGTS